MSYLLTDDAMGEHPKLENLSDRAFRLHMLGLWHCARNLTDGLVSEPSYRGLRAKIKARKCHVDELEAAGLWRRYDGHGYIIHDYLKHNPTAAEVKQRREDRAAAGRLGGKRSGEARRQASAEASASPLLKLAVEPHPIPSHSSSALGASCG